MRPRLVAGILAGAVAGLGGGCGDVLGIEAWDVEPGAGGGVGSSAATTGAPTSTATTGSGDGGGGSGGEGDGGGGVATTTTNATTTGGGGEGGCGVPDTSEHCGACGRSCWGGACEGGAVCGPIQIAPISAQTDLLAVGGDHVVFFDGTPALRRVRKSSPSEVGNLGGAPGFITSVTVADLGDGQHAAFHASEGRVTRQLLDAADPTPLSPLADARFYPGGVRAAAGFVYWLDATTSEQQGIYRSSWNVAGAPSLHCPGSGPLDLAMIGPTAFYVRMTTTTRQLLFCSGSAASSFVYEVGHIPHLVETDPAAGMVYYTTFHNTQVDPAVPAAIWRKPAAGGAGEMVLAPAAGDTVNGLAIAGGFIYWRTPAGELLAYPTAGGAVERLASGQVNAVAADPEGVYWSNGAGVWALRRDAP